MMLKYKKRRRKLQNSIKRSTVMNAIEIKDLSKSFRGMYAVDHLNMTVPVGSIYGFIGENGSGKSTTEKLICGHLVPDSGNIRLFGKDYTDAGVRVRVGALIENAGCFPNSSVWDNLMVLNGFNAIFENDDRDNRLFDKRLLYVTNDRRETLFGRFAL